MIDYIGHIFSKISLLDLNVLLLLGLALFGGSIGGRLFQKLRIPQVVGYIAIGIAIGESGLRIVSYETIEMLQPFNYFALGLIGFMIGGELKREVVSRYGKQLISILLCEGIGAFLIVTLSVGIVGTFLLGDWRIAWALGLLLGAIASATAPAATTEVLREYKTRGPLTSTVLGIVAMDDGLALLLFAIASSLASGLIGLNGNMAQLIIHPLYEIIGSISIGLLSGLVLSKILIKYREKERVLAFSIGTVLFVVGLSLAVGVDMLLAVMVLGIMVVNFTPQRSKDVFKVVEGFTPPIYVLFFVLVGAKLNFSHMSLPIALIIVVYLVGRTLGKMFGAKLGARVSGAAKSVQQYLPLCLFSQAGVAIGLSILAAHYFPGEIGNAVVIIVTTTAFILEIIGPAFVKHAVTKAGEVGLNITEEDLMQVIKTEDAMDRSLSFIHKNMHLAEILKVFSSDAHLYYPVVDVDNKLVGVITVDSIKQTLAETELGSLIVADDLMEPVPVTISGETLISEANEILDKYNLEYLPVTTGENKVVGFIERRMLNKLISTKILEFHRRADSLAAA